MVSREFKHSQNQIISHFLGRKIFGIKKIAPAGSPTCGRSETHHRGGSDQDNEYPRSQGHKVSDFQMHYFVVRILRSVLHQFSGRLLILNHCIALLYHLAHLYVFFGYYTFLAIFVKAKKHI